MTEWVALPAGRDDGDPVTISVRLDGVPYSQGPGWGILYLHGFGSSHSGEKAGFFRERAVSSGVPICSFDFRGHGDSGGRLREVTLSRNLEDVASSMGLLADRGWERVVFLGSSFGALTGLWYSALHPGRVAAGLYIAPALGLDETLADWLGQEGTARWREEGVVRIENELGAWDLGWSFVEDFESYVEERLAGLLTTPSLLLQGQLDDRVPWRRVARLAETCSGVEIVLFEDGDHRLVDRKETLWAAMRGFLGRVSPELAVRPVAT